MRSILPIALAGAMLVASCSEGPIIDPTGPMGCCSADFDPANPTASAMVPVRIVPLSERQTSDGKSLPLSEIYNWKD